jgi:hypothetical protein
MWTTWIGVFPLEAGRDALAGLADGKSTVYAATSG